MALSIVIYSDKPDLIPNPESIGEAVALAGEYKITLKFYLVGRHYLTACYAKTKDSPLTNNLRALTKIKIPGKEQPAVKVIPDNRLPPRDDEEIKDGAVIWIYLRGGIKDEAAVKKLPPLNVFVESKALPGLLISAPPIRSSYHVMAILGHYNFDHWYWAPGHEEINYRQVLLDTGLIAIEGGVEEGKRILPPKPFNFLSGAMIPDLPELDRAVLMEWIQLSLTLTYDYLVCNFGNEKLDPVQPPSWTVNVETPPLRAMIDYYGLYPKPNDLTPASQILHSAKYRQLLTQALTRYLSQLIINNKWLTKEKVKSLGGWGSYQVYGEAIRVLPMSK